MVNSQKVRDNKLFKRLNLNYRNFSLKLGFITEVYHTRAVFFSHFNVIRVAKNIFKKKRKKIYKQRICLSVN